MQKAYFVETITFHT